MAERRKSRRSSNGAVALAIVICAGAALGLTYIVSEHSPSRAQQNRYAAENQVTEAAATTVTTTTTEETTTTTTTTAPLPPGSVGKIELSFYEAKLQVGGETVMPWVTMLPEDAIDVTEKWESSDESVAAVDGYGHITPVGNGTCVVRVTSVSNPDVFAEVQVTVGDVTTDAAASSGTTHTTTGSEAPAIEVVSGVTYVNGILIANKTYALPSDYNPGLDADTETAFNEMAAAASQDGLSLWICSGFRSFETQSTLYNNYCARDGKAAADRYSARPGHSEHQTGLGIDINMASDAFNDTPEAKWLAENCWKYGFIIRYPQGKENITGYKYEPWHCRYLGKSIADDVYHSGLTLEEYLNIDSVYAE
ncbi:MAG: D-alanyl-D-alanine carboxypeptidase family protein [Oscillospiraceae bacterium]|nr:D-alanyl-D-alanine carboxypeptidase family protein [Oscillospiraceae bacterium]